LGGGVVKVMGMGKDMVKDWRGQLVVVLWCVRIWYYWVDL